jgi:hypothetical protein
MYLSTGAIFTINLDFVKIIQQNEGDIDTNEEERENHIIDSQNREEHGRPLSYEDSISTCSEEDEDWSEELLHYPIQQDLQKLQEEEHQRRFWRKRGRNQRLEACDLGVGRRDVLSQNAEVEAAACLLGGMGFNA